MAKTDRLADARENATEAVLAFFDELDALADGAPFDDGSRIASLASLSSLIELAHAEEAAEAEPDDAG